MSKLTILNLSYHNCGPINLIVEAGECVCITGQSGVGKSLLLRAIADLDPHIGEIYLNNKEQSEIQPFKWRKRVALMPSENKWWHNNVGAHFREINDHLLDILGFDVNVMKWEINRLSTGESQRLALLRLLSNMPDVLLLDEPTIGLDMTNRVIVENVVTDYLSHTGAAAIWVSHDNEQVTRVAKKHFIFKDGTLQNVKS